jgi:LPXTG-motif cell wall-anchored protein
MQTIRVDLFRNPSGTESPYPNVWAEGTEIAFANLRFVRSLSDLTAGYQGPSSGGDTPQAPPTPRPNNPRTADTTMVALAIIALTIASGAAVFVLRKIKA